MPPRTGRFRTNRPQRWGKPRLRYGIFAGIAVVLATCAYGWAETPADRMKHVLVLYGREMSPAAVLQLESNIRQSLTDNYPFPLRFYSEHMNATVLKDEPAVAEQMAWYERKYRDADLDLIVALGVERYSLPQDFFAGIPVVYGKWRFDGGRVTRANTTEVNVWLGNEFSKTMELVLKLHPDVQQIVVIGGNATFDKELLAEAARELSPFSARAKVTYWSNLSTGEITRRAAALPSGTIILFTFLQSDADGAQVLSRNFLAGLSSKSSVPIYAVMDTLVGFGAVGGYVTSYEREGQIVGATAARILAGEQADSIRPEVRQASFYMFDGRELARWGIARDQLPLDSTVMFEPPGIWPRYKWQIVVVLTVAVLQTLVIAVLVLQMARRRRAERALEESEARFRSMYQYAAVGIEQVAPDERLLMVNPALCRMLGYTEPELLSKTIAGITDPSDRERELVLLKSLVAGERDSYCLEKRYLHSSGSPVWVNVTTSAVRDPVGRLLYRISVIEDITERKQAEEAVRTLAGRIISAQEEERTRIAREIHDDFSQRLALLQIQQQQLQQELGDRDSSQFRGLRVMSQQVAALASDLRRVSHELHSAALENVGLTAALEELCEEVSKAHGIKVAFLNRGIPSELPADVALCLFRVVQQALANVVKHSGAAKAQVEIAAEAGRLVLRIADAGCGFAVTPSKGGLGLISMRERVHLLAGIFRIESQPGRGTELSVELPVAVTQGRPATARSAVAGGD